MSRTAVERVADILEAIERCQRYRERFHDPDPEVVEMAFQAAIRYVAVIGEAANHLPDAVRAAAPTVPWPAIVEMRNVLIHEYFGVDTSVVERTIDRDLLPLAQALRGLSLGD